MVTELKPKSAYLALDPGETTGWATFNHKGDPITMGQFKQAEQTKVLSELIHSDLKHVIVEDYRNYASHKQARWSRNTTSKNIGAIQLLCELRGVFYTLQSASVKHIGYKWGGLPDGPPSNHSISHQYDAYVHGVYWLQNNGVCPAGYHLKGNK